MVFVFPCSSPVVKGLNTVSATSAVVIQYNFEFKHDKYPLESYYFVNTHPQWMLKWIERKFKITVAHRNAVIFECYFFIMKSKELGMLEVTITKQTRAVANFSDFYFLNGAEIRPVLSSLSKNSHLVKNSNKFKKYHNLLKMVRNRRRMRPTVYALRLQNNINALHSQIKLSSEQCFLKIRRNSLEHPTLCMSL